MSVEYWPGELLRKPMLAIITSSRIVPAGLLIVSVVVVVPACAAARNAIPALPSVTLTLLIDTDGVGSLSTIVPTPWPVPMVAFVGPLRLTKNVSSASSSPSSITTTVTGCAVTPGANVKVPAAAV